MLRQFALGVCGFVALTCGLVLCAQALPVLQATPAPVAIGCSVPDAATTACKSPAKTCEGQDGETTCTALNGNAFYADHVETFPKSCLSTTDKKVCNTPLRNCSRNTTCSWDAAKTPPCQENATTAFWTQAGKPELGTFPEGGQCATVVP